eukprot:7507801-Heterocapsa_arctica.AAC.1
MYTSRNASWITPQESEQMYFYKKLTIYHKIVNRINLARKSTRVHSRETTYRCRAGSSTAGDELAAVGRWQGGEGLGGISSRTTRRCKVGNESAVEALRDLREGLHGGTTRKRRIPSQALLQQLHKNRRMASHQKVQGQDQ